jgi:hypothetical protein
LSDGTLSELRPVVDNFQVPFGFTFADGASGQPPLVELEIVAREAVTEREAVHTLDDSTSTTFRLIRDEANAELRRDEQQVQTVQIASTTRVEAIGTASSSDMFVIDTAGGPLQMLPIVFDGGDDNPSGDLDDVLVVEGSGVTVDLNTNITLVGVEFVDIRGAGVNAIDVAAPAVSANLDPSVGVDQIFYVLLDPGEDQHNVDAEHDWVFQSEVEKDDGIYDLYTQEYEGDTVRVAIYREAKTQSSLLAIDAAFAELDPLTDNTIEGELVLQLARAQI